MIKKNDFVCIYLQNPREKFWGRVLGLDSSGVHFNGLEIKSYPDWCQELAAGNDPTIFPGIFFVPSWRLEKILLDQTQGIFESFVSQFKSKTNLDLESEIPPVD